MMAQAILLPATWVLVHVSSTDPNATLLPDRVFVTGDAGSVSLPVILRTAGAQTIQVADGNNSLLGTLSVSVQPAAATKLILTSPGSTPAGQAFGLTVSAWDAFNNIATGYLGTIVFGATDVNAILPPSLILTGGMTTLNAAV